MDSRGSIRENDKEKKAQKSYFDVLGLCCSSEVILVEKILKNLEGVKDVQAIVTTKTVIVLHDSLLVSDFQIVKALNQAKLEASIRMKGAKTYKNKWPNKYAIGSGICLLISFLRYIYHPLGWFALGAVAIGIYPIAFKAIMGLRNFTLDINFLVLIAVGGSIALKDYWEAGTIVFLFTIAEWLESRASHKATAAMSSLANLVPQRAVLAETGEEVQVGDVEVNTLLAVKEGEVIPFDGVVIDGSCEIDEKTLTGESFPVSKQKDSDVWAGTININGYVVIKTTVVAEDCVVARMTKLVEEAQSNKSRVERYIETCAKYYTPAIMIISIAIATIPAALRVHNVRHFYRLAIVVLVGACPCALVLSTPVAMCCALIRASTFGVFFKGGQYVEALAKVKTIAFDKTGTITRGEFEVIEFKPLVDDIDLSTLLYWASSIERKSSHPLAAAVVDYAESHSIEPQPHKVEEFHNYVGEGIYGKIDGKQIYIGNHKIANRAGCQSVPKLEGNIVNGKSIGYVFIESRAVGIFCLSDVCRTGVKEALKMLKSMGIKTAMLTGDCQSAAEHVQDQLGGYLEVVYSELLPEDKAKIIKEFQQKGFTAMTGDGINDAPAMATADVGISMGISGSALAVETAHVILMTNDIQRIPQAIKLARKVKRKIIENIVLSIMTKSAIIALAIAGHPLVWAAVLADVGTCLVVILNSMLLLRGMPSHGHSHHHHHKTCCNNDKSEQINSYDSHKPSCAMDCSHDIKSNLLSCTCYTSPHHHETCFNDDKSQQINGCDSHKACCNDDKQQQSKGCDSHDASHAMDCSHDNKSSLLTSTCYTRPHHHDHHHHHHKTCCNDDKPQQINGCDSHKTCCNDDKPQQINGCDSYDASSAMDCSNESKSNLLSNTCCTSETSECKPSPCNAHRICETISLNNVCCSVIKQEPSAKLIEHHVSIENKSNSGKEVKNEHGCSFSETSPHRVTDQLARTNHSCSIHKKNNGHSSCKIQADNSKSDHHHHHHHHEGCGSVKSCGNEGKKHMVSCCEDFRRECCLNNGHLQDKSRGGLSEIVVVVE